MQSNWPAQAEAWLNTWTDDRLVVSPPGEGNGYWAGAPYLLADGDTLYLYYRLRRPRGEGRGYEVRIAASSDAEHFTDVWRLRKEELGTSSVERGALVRTRAGFRLYLSYVDPERGQWRTDACEAPTVAALDVAKRFAVVEPWRLGLEAAKDPVLVPDGSGWKMLVSCSVSTEPVDHSRLHGGQDVFTTGLVTSPTGLLVSEDGRRFTWRGTVLTPDPGHWDAYITRVTTAIPSRRGGYLCLYDGGESVEQNYEEIASFAVSPDLTHFEKFPGPGPRLRVSEGTGTWRYGSAERFQGQLFLAYERARADGSHELRMTRVGEVDVDAGH